MPGGQTQRSNRDAISPPGGSSPAFLPTSMEILAILSHHWEKRGEGSINMRDTSRTPAHTWFNICTRGPSCGVLLLTITKHLSMQECVVGEKGHSQHVRARLPSSRLFRVLCYSDKKLTKKLLMFTQVWLKNRDVSINKGVSRMRGQTFQFYTRY